MTVILNREEFNTCFLHVNVAFLYFLEFEQYNEINLQLHCQHLRNLNGKTYVPER